MEEGIYEVYSVKNVGWLTGGRISPVIPPKDGTKATLSHLSISPQHHGQSKPVKVGRLHFYFFFFSCRCLRASISSFQCRRGMELRRGDHHGRRSRLWSRKIEIHRSEEGDLCLIPALGYRAGRWVKVVCPAELRRYYVRTLAAPMLSFFVPMCLCSVSPRRSGVLPRLANKL